MSALALVGNGWEAEEGPIYSTQGLREEGVTSVSAEENLRVLDSVFRALNDHDLTGLDDVNAENVIMSQLGEPNPLKGRAAVRQMNESLFAAFPDLKIHKEREYGHSDWVSAEVVMTGTHKGPLTGFGGQTIPATNKSVKLRAAITAKVENGKQKEVNLYFDRLDLMNQLGLAP